MDCPERIWTSVDLHNIYMKGGGSALSRKQLMSKLKEYFGEKVLILTSPGIANIVVFRTQASTVLNVVKDDVADEDIEIDILARKVRKEVKEIPKQKKVYKKHIDFNVANADVCPAINDFLYAISPKF